jgi:hypothetical protein
MSTTFKTKWGMRRVRQEPPTLDEALIAAEAMAEDADSRAEIASQLMGVPVEEVRAALSRQHSRGRSTLVAGRSRAVVVEYKRPRTISRPAVGPMGRR